jgi:hypothetical protein
LLSIPESNSFHDQRQGRHWSVWSSEIDLLEQMVSLFA